MSTKIRIAAALAVTAVASLVASCANGGPFSTASGGTRLAHARAQVSMPDLLT